MKPNPSSSNAQATPNTTNTTGLTPEITDTLKKLVLSVQSKESAAPKVSPEKAQDIKDPSSTDTVSQAQPVKSTKRTFSVPSARGAMRVLGINGGDTVALQREGTKTSTVRQASRKDNPQTEGAKPSSKSTSAREESRKSSRKESLTDSRRTSSRTDRAGSRNDEASQTLKSYQVDALLKDGSTLKLKINSATPITKDSKRVQRAVEEANRKIDLKKAETERKDAEMAMRLHEEENYAAPHPYTTTYASPYSKPIRTQYSYYSPAYSRQSYEQGGVHYADLRRNYHHSYQDNGREAQGSRSKLPPDINSKEYVDALAARVDRKIENKDKEIAAYDSKIAEIDNQLSTLDAQPSKPKSKTEVPSRTESFNLIGHGDFKLVDYNQIKSDFLSNGIHKSISSKNSDCWIRSTWTALLSEVNETTFAASLTSSLGKEFAKRAQYLSKIITPLKYDTQSVFTTFSRADDIIDTPSQLKYPSEPYTENLTYAEDDIFELTAAILRNQAIPEHKIEDSVLGNDFGGDELIQALANELNVKFIMLSDISKEVTVHAPKDSQLAQELNDALRKEPNESQQKALASIIKKHFEDTPVVLHVDLFKKPNTETPAPQDASHEDDYKFMTGNHFEVILPSLMGHSLLD